MQCTMLRIHHSAPTHHRYSCSDFTADTFKMLSSTLFPSLFTSFPPIPSFPPPPFLPASLLLSLLSPFAHTFPLASHFSPLFSHNFYPNLLSGTDLTIWGTGAPLRQFIYSRDLAKLTVLEIKSYLILSYRIFLSHHLIYHIIYSYLILTFEKSFDGLVKYSYHGRVTD